MYSNRSGSVLIGVVVVAAVLSVSAMAYAALVRNIVSHEVQAYDDTRARLVAEAGLHMAANWLCGADNFAEAKKGGVTIDVPSHYADMDCKVTIANTAADGVLLLTSRVIEPNRLPYVKSVSMEVTGIPNNASGRYALHVNNLSPSAFEPVGANKGLAHTTVAFGPVHSNTPIMFSWRAFNTSDKMESGFDVHGDGFSVMTYGVRFYGPVTTWGGWHDDPNNAMPPGVISGFGASSRGNDYGRGVLVNTSGGAIPSGFADKASYEPDIGLAPEEQFDRIFRSTYNSESDQVFMGFDGALESAGNIDVKYTLGTNGDLSNVNFNSVPDSANYKPTILFGHDAAGPFYRFSVTGTNLNTAPRVAINPAKETIIYAGARRVVGGGNPHATAVTSGKADIAGKHNLTIASGSVLSGKVTVITGDNRDIVFNLESGDPNNIHKSNFLYEGMTIPSISNQNVRTKKNSTEIKNVSQISDDHFDNYLEYSGLRADEFAAMGNEAGLDLHGGSKPINHLFGFYSGRDVVLKRNHNVTASDYNNNPIITAQLFACANKNGKVRIEHTIATTGTWGFRVHVVGAVSMGDWWNPNPGHTSGDANSKNKHLGAIRTYHDLRKENGEFLSIPGVRYGYDINGNRIGHDVTLTARKWSETNTPR